MNDSGLLSAGYDYFCLDGMFYCERAEGGEDCWMANKRSKKGDSLPDLKSGMKSFGEAIHSMEMKFGLYESVGVITCQHLPGSLCVRLWMLD